MSSPSVEGSKKVPVNFLAEVKDINQRDQKLNEKNKQIDVIGTELLGMMNKIKESVPQNKKLSSQQRKILNESDKVLSNLQKNKKNIKNKINNYKNKITEKSNKIDYYIKIFNELSDKNIRERFQPKNDTEVSYSKYHSESVDLNPEKILDRIEKCFSKNIEDLKEMSEKLEKITSERFVLAGSVNDKIKDIDGSIKNYSKYMNSYRDPTQNTIKTHVEELKALRRQAIELENQLATAAINVTGSEEGVNPQDLNLDEISTRLESIGKNTSENQEIIERAFFEGGKNLKPPRDIWFTKIPYKLFPNSLEVSQFRKKSIEEQINLASHVKQPSTAKPNSASAEASSESAGELGVSADELGAGTEARVSTVVESSLTSSQEPSSASAEASAEVRREANAEKPSDAGVGELSGEKAFQNELYKTLELRNAGAKQKSEAQEQTQSYAAPVAGFDKTSLSQEVKGKPIQFGSTVTATHKKMELSADQFQNLWTRTIDFLKDESQPESAKKTQRSILRELLSDVLDDVNKDGSMSDETRKKLTLALIMKPEVFTERILSANKKEYLDLRNKINIIYSDLVKNAHDFPKDKIDKDTLLSDLTLFSLNNKDLLLDILHLDSQMDIQNEANTCNLKKFVLDWQKLGANKTDDRSTMISMIEGCLNDLTKKSSFQKLEYIFKEESSADIISKINEHRDDDSLRLYEKLLQNEATFGLLLETNNLILSKPGIQALKDQIKKEPDFAEKLLSMASQTSAYATQEEITRSVKIVNVVRDYYEEEAYPEARKVDEETMFLGGSFMSAPHMFGRGERVKQQVKQQASEKVKALMNKIAESKKLDIVEIKEEDVGKAIILPIQEQTQVYDQLPVFIALNEIAETEKTFATALHNIDAYGHYYAEMLKLEVASSGELIPKKDLKHSSPSPLQNLFMLSSQLQKKSKAIEEHMRSFETKGCTGGDLNTFFSSKLWEEYTGLIGKFAENYAGGRMELEQLGRRAAFRSIVENPFQSTNLDINSMLVTPIQRLPRWVLLMKEFQKHAADLKTPFHQFPDSAGRVVNAKIAFAAIDLP